MRMIQNCLSRVHTSLVQSLYRVHTDKYGLNSRSFQELLKASPTVFKDLQLMKNTDLSVKL